MEGNVLTYNINNFYLEYSMTPTAVLVLVVNRMGYLVFLLLFSGC